MRKEIILLDLKENNKCKHNSLQENTTGLLLSSMEKRGGRGYWEGAHIYTHAHTLHSTTVRKPEGSCVFKCPKKLPDHTSNSAQDKNWALRWPSVAGSLMTSTSLAQTGQWFPLRTGLFDLSAELVESVGQGERPPGQPNGQTCDEFRLIATDSTFYLFSFLVISSNRFFFFLSYSAASSSEVVWKQRFLTSNHKLGRCRFK